MSRKLEILAPVGNAQMLSAAVFGGADAVYLGLTGFNARRTAGNFTPEELQAAVAFCHGRGVHVHVTLNTLVYDRELPDLTEAIRTVAECGADAVIVDDLATARLVKQIAPTLALHGSTQMAIHTAAGALQLAKMGYDRVILARELTLPEIREICAVSPIECEVFVHGAICFAMSGQCMMSAFLGGRSGNRGACAGPCRLPFDADPRLRPGQPGKNCHMSLKDMDLVPHLQELMEAGVASVKIEGRLRTPEYTAVSAASCYAAREGKPYDAQLLSDIFSRSGFSDAYLMGRNDGTLFGVRTDADAERTKAAMPKARELFRREMQRVPVHFTVDFDEEGVKLTAADEDGNRAIAYSENPPQFAQKDQSEAIRRALGKTGGTPFLCAEVTLNPGEEGETLPTFLPGSEWNELRRQTLDALLKKRETLHPHAVHPVTLPEFSAHTLGQIPQLCARFQTVEQIPAEWVDKLHYLILPIAEANKLPENWRRKAILELPRARYGNNEVILNKQLRSLNSEAFAGVAINNLGDFQLADGWKLFGSMGLNITNPLSASRCVEMGVEGLLVHPETALTAMRGVAPAVPTAALCYAHMPVMLTRACPLRNVRNCGQCDHKGNLRDRKGRDFPVRCSASGKEGIRTVYNPVPLYMGDRMTELPVDYAVAAFTIESRDRAAEVLELLTRRAAFDGEFTRGLYYTNN